MRIMVVFDFPDIQDIESVAAARIISTLEGDCNKLCTGNEFAFIEHITEDDENDYVR